MNYAEQLSSKALTVSTSGPQHRSHVTEVTSCKDILVSAAQHTPAAMPQTLRADSEGPSQGLHTLLLHHLPLNPQLSHSHTKFFVLQQKNSSTMQRVCPSPA